MADGLADRFKDGERSQVFGPAFSGFSKLTLEERLSKLETFGFLSPSETLYLRTGGLKDFTLGEKFIENVIGYFQIPLGVATHFRINQKDALIPMAVEETSIIAAASKTAKWVRDAGLIETSMIGSEAIGQIQFARVKNYELVREKIAAHAAQLIELINADVAAGLLRRGGGARRFELRRLERPDGGIMAVLHLYVDAVDAMGANIINQACEYLKPRLEELTGERVTMCILSNLVDSKLTKTKVILEKIEPDLAAKIEEASLFAELDPYRAATNNKGVMNGIDAVLIATGNDWRAVEAGMHAYAVRDGQYRSLTTWKRDGKHLVGELIAPLIVGTVGGVTNLHPTAKIAMKILDHPTAAELSQIAAAVGLVQNLGALRALTTVGIIEGHMKLHMKNLGLGAGASEEEMPALVQKLEELFAYNKRISLSHAIELLEGIRANGAALGSESRV